MQKPHCTANWSTKACCRGWRPRPSAGAARPSMVVTSAAVGPCRGDQAGQHGDAVEVDGAGAALALGAALLGAGEADLVPQPVEQRHARRAPAAVTAVPLTVQLDRRGVVVGDRTPPARDRRRRGPPRKTGRAGQRSRSRPSRSAGQGAADHHLDLLGAVGRPWPGRRRSASRPAAASRAASAIVASSRVRPTRCSSAAAARDHRRGHAAQRQAGRGHRAVVAGQPDDHRQVDDGDGLGPALAELHEHPALVRRPASGTSRPTISSPGSSTVAPQPGEQLPHRHPPLAPAPTAGRTTASSAHSAEMVSLAGLAVTRLPATVARFRSAGEPTSRQAWAKRQRPVDHEGGADHLVVGDQAARAAAGRRRPRSGPDPGCG